MKPKNNNLHKAKKAKNDEFYTLLKDVEAELKYYESHFKDKVVYCNCDAKHSMFLKYFTDNFKRLGLKKLLNCHLRADGTGGFECAESIKLLEEADIVVTNPPFSLFRPYMAQLIKYDKKFLIIGNMNAVTYREIFPLIKDNKIWIGNTFPKEFIEPNGDVTPINSAWYTNIIPPIRVDIPLTKTYNPTDYPKYDNYDAINVDKVKDIPKDYYGAMGVPITFLAKYSPPQFEIVGHMSSTKVEDGNLGYPYIKGKKKYARVIIKRTPQVKKFGNIVWFTNMTSDVTKPDLPLTKTYNPTDYPKYDNYDAINVNKLKDIPKDYYGVMGVPITFLAKYSPPQFEILASQRWCKGQEIARIYKGSKTYDTDMKTTINGKETYDRIFIKRTPQFEIIGCCEPCIDLEILKQQDKFTAYKSRQLVSNGKVCQKMYHRILIKRTPQFELLGLMNTGEQNIGIRHVDSAHGRPLVNGVEKFLRVLIKRTKDET